jgi:hypothetical protein
MFLTKPLLSCPEIHADKVVRHEELGEEMREATTADRLTASTSINGPLTAF